MENIEELLICFVLPAAKKNLMLSWNWSETDSQVPGGSKGGMYERRQGEQKGKITKVYYVSVSRSFILALPHCVPQCWLGLLSCSIISELTYTEHQKHTHSHGCMTTEGLTGCICSTINVHIRCKMPCFIKNYRWTWTTYTRTDVMCSSLSHYIWLMKQMSHIINNVWQI